MSATRMREAALLLMGCGLCLGSTFPLQKLAAAAGVPPASWVFASTLGASLLLTLGAVLKGRPPSGAHRLYYLIAALVSFVLPNLIVFIVIPKIGAGLTAVMFALSPILTLTVASLVARRLPAALGVVGILVGLAGVLVIIAFRGDASSAEAPLGWVLLGLMIPVCLASGNVYRSHNWPAGADSLSLASAINLVAAGLLFSAVFASGEGMTGLAAVASVPLLIAAQVVATGANLAMFFRLQQVGGPVYLSQIVDAVPARSATLRHALH
ncbi:EamA family transporter [Phreatobacter sp.]|uniref:EamA family transporter n=1 Tax=Phreatobacter sp. TaxID=1966341 RepID=UPI0022C6C10E|nr:EamA family transporter [Phreatobacter sp.]MCZ8315145.1 EamA family transporter [Phreatobacter sp.]